MNVRLRYALPIALMLAALALPSIAAIRLPAVFGDHMVIQRDKPVVVWGWAGPKEEITVRLAGREARSAAGADGRWRVDLPAVQSGGGPLEMTVSGAQSAPLVLKDV